MLADWAFISGHGQISLSKWKFTLLSLCITSIPATMATLVMIPLGNGSWGRGWLVHIKYLQIIFFLPFITDYSHTSSPNLLVTISLSCFFQVPDHSAKPLATAHGSICNCLSSHFSLSEKWTMKSSAWNSIQWEIFLYHHPSGMSSVHLQVVPAKHGEQTVGKAWVFSSSVDSHEAIVADWKWEGSVAGMGGHENCKLLLHIASLCLQGLTGPNSIHSTSVWWWMLLCMPNCIVW